MIGTLLTWLQERSSPVFVVATSNDVSKLPPELLRKGRFDELFFVDLPRPDLRARILALQVRRRGRDPEDLDLERLVAASEGFSGAELEQAVVSGLYEAFSRQRELDTELLLGELEKTKPLSVTMAEPIASLRAWAAGRTTPADAERPGVGD
jgi:SpoVK/Ycf46/Vps4 family AAA+-type ATPase